MKFSNGCWLNKLGLEVYTPQEVYDVIKKEKSVEVIVPCQRIKTRGDTLAGPVLTYEIDSPLKDVFRVRINHYKGGTHKGPEYQLHIENQEIEIETQKEKLAIKSGNLELVMSSENGFKMDFSRKGKHLTSSRGKSAAYIKEYDTQFLNECVETAYMREQLGLSVDELIYGLGERFTPFIKNGQSIETWNGDGGTSTEQSYKSIPFYISNRGYGVFVNHPENVSFEVGSEKVTKVQFSVPGQVLEYYVIAGDNMKEVLMNYTTLTGKPALPPAWSFGLWLTTSFTTNYDEETVTGFVDGMADRDIPLRVFHFDCFWMKGFHWCDFTWDDEVFPEPMEMLKRMKEKGLKICVWINPYIGQASSLFDEGKEKGYFIKRKNGDVWQFDMWQPGMAIVDFTNPDACKWYQEKLSYLLDMGVDCFKTDFGERIPTEGIVYHDGSNPFKMHNYYTQLYNKVVFELIQKKKGEKEAVLFARSATAGGQCFPVHWGGDCEANYESMAESLRGGLSLCLSGFGFWSHDIGGFESTSTADVYKRWAAFGLLSSHSRLHGSSSYRVPWLYDEEAVDVVRFFSRLKCKMMPYLFKSASDTARTGVSTMRAMMLEFEEDPTCMYLDKQYMLGDHILVAPIFNDESIAKYYIPEGKWTNFLTDEVIEGGKWVTQKHSYLSIPMLVRPNSLIAIGKEENVPDYDYADDVKIIAYQLEEGKVAQTQVINVNEEIELEVKVLKQNNTLTIEYTGVGKAWTMILKGVHGVKEVEGGTVSELEDGIHIQAKQEVGTMVCYF
ncbi:MAG: alpha-xylosidase [Cellulosilyticum sp.]|nr:alpha-xylosidase [Cellulosilyticum sp.]